MGRQLKPPRVKPAGHFSRRARLGQNRPLSKGRPRHVAQPLARRERRHAIQPPRSRTMPSQHQLPKPAVKPETISPDSGDFPFLPPMPGSMFNGGGHDDAPMIVTLNLVNG